MCAEMAHRLLSGPAAIGTFFPVVTDAKTKRGGRRVPPGGRPRKRETRPHFATALDYAMAVINDSEATARRRDTLAMAVLRCGYQMPTAKASTDNPTGKKAAANLEAQTAHQDSEWGSLVQ